MSIYPDGGLVRARPAETTEYRPDDQWLETFCLTGFGAGKGLGNTTSDFQADSAQQPARQPLRPQSAPSKGRPFNEDPGIRGLDPTTYPKPRPAWVPAGPKTAGGLARAAPLPRISGRRPLTVPTYVPEPGGEDEDFLEATGFGSGGVGAAGSGSFDHSALLGGSLGAAPQAAGGVRASVASTRGGGARRDRTPHQLEDALRQWLASHRKLHQKRRETLLRSLTACCDVPTDRTGYPLALLVPPEPPPTAYKEPPGPKRYVHPAASEPAEKTTSIDGITWLQASKAPPAPGDSLRVEKEGAPRGPPEKRLEVSEEDFCMAWELMLEEEKRRGVAAPVLRAPLTPSEVGGLFDRHPHSGSAAGNLSVKIEALAEVVLADPSTALGHSVHHGPLPPTGAAAAGGGTTQPQQGGAGKGSASAGKILYFPCRKAVYAPSDWDPRLAQQSATPPEQGLELEWVHGYQGVRNTAPNLFFTARGEVVWHVAAVGVVYDPGTHRQRHFLGHTDDIACLAMHPGRSLVATGQMGLVPCVCVWDSETCQVVARVDLDEGDRAVQAVAFNAQGDKLVAVATNNAHTVTVWDWKAGTKLGSGAGYNGMPPQVFGAAWNHFTDGDQFLTFGVKHAKLWGPDPSGKGGFASKSMMWGKAEQQNVLCAAFLPGGTVATGHPSGHVYLWVDRKCHVVLDAHGVGTGRGVACMHVVAGLKGGGGAALVTAGSDGQLKQWPVRKGVLDAQPAAEWPVQSRGAGGGGRGSGGGGGGGDPHAYGGGGGAFGGTAGSSDMPNLGSTFGSSDGPNMLLGASQSMDTGGGGGGGGGRLGGDGAPSVRAFDYDPDGGRFVVGTAMCQVLLMEADPAGGSSPSPAQLIAQGHTEDVLDVSFHPDLDGAHPLYVTAALSGRVRVWSVESRRLVSSIRAPWGSCAVAFSPSGKQVAVGFRDGAVRAYDAGTGEEVAHVHYARSEVGVLRYSPGGGVLAAGSHDCVVDLLRVGRGYRKAARCVGHSATITGIDFSADGRVLCTTCNGNEVLYFDAASGLPLVQNQRDTEWAGWTNKLGFPVMGIWEGGMSGNDINSVCRSHEVSVATGYEELLVAGDDYGRVRLLRYPCVVEDAPAHSYGGHSSHVMGTRFSPDDERVVSVGGRDLAVMQWRVRADGAREQEMLARSGPPASAIGGNSASAGPPKGIADKLLAHKDQGNLYAKARMAMFEQQLLDELAVKPGRGGSVSRAGKRDDAKSGVKPPRGKVWGPLDPQGKTYGWVVDSGHPGGADAQADADEALMRERANQQLQGLA